jgi:type IV fimbrial biogenesis protein FimT
MLTHPLRRPRRGVSMIEVAITLTLLAVLVFAVMPDVVAMVANSRIRSAAESYTQGLQRARNDALRTNRPVSFWLTSVNGSGNLDNTCALSAGARGWIVSINDPAGKCATAISPTADPMIAERAVAGSTAGNVSVAGLQSDGTTAATSVTFDGFGRVTSATALARIDLDHGNAGNNFRPLRIQITRGGSVRLCEPRVTDAGDPRICL